jgi:hypothetical protein
MLRRLAVAALVLVVLTLGWTLRLATEPAAAQEPQGLELTVPRAYGALKATIGEGALVFEAADGTVRIVAGGRVIVTVRRS